MSSSNPSDPRLLLPEWLRDGDLPASIRIPEEEAPIASPTQAEAAPVEMHVVLPAVPYSDRLSLDTRLDPAQLVSAADLPKWLGGLERIESTKSQPTIQLASTHVIESSTAPPIQPEIDEDIEPAQDRIVDVQINGWMMVAGAVGLLVLLAAALKLYLS